MSVFVSLCVKCIYLCVFVFLCESGRIFVCYYLFVCICVIFYESVKIIKRINKKTYLGGVNKTGARFNLSFTFYLSSRCYISLSSGMIKFYGYQGSRLIPTNRLKDTLVSTSQE